MNDLVNHYNLTYGVNKRYIYLISRVGVFNILWGTLRQ